MPPSEEVTRRELDEQRLDLLPDRAALGLVDITTITVVPVNLAIAVNAASVGQLAAAAAQQHTAILG